MKKTILQFWFGILALFVLVGCSGGEADYSLNDINPDRSGRFIDSAVEGLEYQYPDGKQALTGKGGTFQYKKDDTLGFYIGALSLGSSEAGFILTPRELAHNPGSIQEPAVSNRVRLMLALDQDSDRLGVQIDGSLRSQASTWEPTIDFLVSEADFTAEVQRVTHNEIITLPSATVANTHFEKTLTCAYSGAYQGAWNVPDSNDSSGYVGVMVQANGDVILMGDGQTVPSVQLNDGTVLAEQNNSIVYVVGHDDINTKSYSFDTNVSYYYNRTIKQLLGVENSAIISGVGESISYDQVEGTFANGPQNGSYHVQRADASKNAAFRYTGIGVDDSGVIGLLIMDFEKNGHVVGLIHDARDITNQPQLDGNIDFNTGDITVTVDMQGQQSMLRGNIYENDIVTQQLRDVNLSWESMDGVDTYGYVEVDGCQLQAVD